MKDKPLISILLATYNRAHLIAETLCSVQAQSFINFECIIIDDGGADNTAAVLAPFLEDTRFRFKIRPENYRKGLPGCRNYGLDLAIGDYIIFFDDDDVIHPQNLEIGLAIFQSNPTANYAHYAKQSFTESQAIAQLPKIDSYKERKASPLAYQGLIAGVIGFASCTVLWKAACFKEIRFNDTLQYAEEWECYTRILINFPEGIITDAVLYYNRKHPESNTGEFFSGNSKRKEGKVAASKLVITYLNDHGLLSSKLQKFFTWESVLLQESDVYKHLVKQSKMTAKSKWKAWFYYSFSPLIKIYLKNKKNH
jgi:GalNAc5-diNAcBac-PP-undecaprenol beta-1,3-glucosyltransferase